MGKSLTTSLVLALVLLSCDGGQSAVPDAAIGLDADVDSGVDADGEVDLEELDVDLVDWATAVAAGLPGEGSEGFVVPSDDELARFGRAVDAVLALESDAPQLSVAAAEAASVDYRLVRIIDRGGGDASLLALLPNPSNSAGRGSYVVRGASEVNHAALVGAPHPVFELGTAPLAAEIYRALQARGLAIAGAHRCANGAATPCDGRSTVCNDGVSGSYHESDMAHQDRSFFQVFHQRLLDRSAETRVLSVHGKSTSAGAPEVIVSDGSDVDSLDEHWGPNRLVTIIEERLAAAVPDAVGASCNRVGDEDVLCGTTNVQGRAANGVASDRVCFDSASGASGRFLHLELSRDLRLPGEAFEPILVVDSLVELFASP